MLLGGFGFLSRLHGLSIDNLVEVEMVLADGRIVIVSENEYPGKSSVIAPDCILRFLQTCGGRFVVRAPVWASQPDTKQKPILFQWSSLVISSRKSLLIECKPITDRSNFSRFNTATAPSLIKHFRDCVKGAPRELYANVLLTAGPADKESLVVIQMCYIGPREKGQEYLHALSSWDGESCLLHEVDEKSFLHQQDSVAQVLRGKGIPLFSIRLFLLHIIISILAGRQWYIRSALISSLPDEIINETVIQFANTPVGCSTSFLFLPDILMVVLLTAFYSQPGCLRLQEVLLRISRTLVCRSRREMLHSRLLLSTNGKWTSGTIGVSIPQRR
jgi:hypothetical protein